MVSGFYWAHMNKVYSELLKRQVRVAAALDRSEGLRLQGLVQLPRHDWHQHPHREKELCEQDTDILHCW